MGSKLSILEVEMIRVFTLPFDPTVCGFDDSDFGSFLSEIKLRSIEYLCALKPFGVALD